MSTSASKDLQEAATTSTTADATRPTVAVDENLACQWDKCSERCASAEALFAHICDKHVGRKSTNNLNLTCGWASCRTTTVKRDHITSHVRVHVPLKPHKCDFCGKAFKRPQDLKKHVKTHADDTILRPEADVRLNSRSLKGVQMMNAIHYRGASTSTYYDQGVNMAGTHAPYANVHPAQGSYYTTQQQPSYGPVYYPSNHGADMGHHASYDNRKRSIDTLNDFFGDAKRRQIDPSSYTQVGQRLLSLHGLPIQHGGLPEYMSAEPSLVSVDGHHGGSHGQVSTHQYALPSIPNLRTKTDLVTIDKFLEEIQATVYESSNAAAAAGVHQPGAHFTHSGLNFRQSHSPPQSSIQYVGHMNSNVPSSHSAPVMSNHPSTQSNPSSTPILTPSSSNMSYTSGHSPVSSHGMSPVSKNNSATSTAYPSLPAVSLSYASQSTTAPTSTLGTNFDNDPRRRYSGGMLQRSSRTPRAIENIANLEGTCETALTNRKVEMGNNPANNIDPALAEASSPTDLSESSESARDREEEAWIENIRVIEALRLMVSDRLRRKDYEVDDENISDTVAKSKQANVQIEDSGGLYPNLRANFDSA